jgi:hypothetical protein
LHGCTPQEGEDENTPPSQLSNTAAVRRKDADPAAAAAVSPVSVRVAVAAAAG